MSKRKPAARRVKGAGNQRRVDPAVQQRTRRESLLRIGRMLLLTLCVGASVAGMLWLNQAWRVQHWEIKAEAPIKQAIEAELQAMQNKDFLHTRPELLRQQWLARIPDMAAVRISRVLPDALYIQADARVPMALWQDEQNRLHLFDDQGTVYRLLRQGESPDLPLLRVSERQLVAVQQMLSALALHDEQRLPALSEIRASSRHWKLYFSHGARWLVPKGNEAAVIDRIKAILQQPRWRQRHWRVDARLASRWFIRPAGHGGII